MRIHTNMSEDVMRQAIRNVGTVSVIKLDRHGSRSRSHAFELALSGSGKHGGMYGNLDYPTATWDEWGMVIAALFIADPELAIPRAYVTEDHFHWVTGDRFRTLTPAFQHKRHRWDANGLSATGMYSTFDCNCGAHQRSLATWRGYTVADVV